MNQFAFVLAQAASQPNSLSGLLPLILIIVVFYFFMIRPQVKRQKELKNFRNGLNKGDKILTTGGIYGKIVEIQEHTVTMEVDTNVKLKVDKQAILKDTGDLPVQK